MLEQLDPNYDTVSEGFSSKKIDNLNKNSECNTIILTF